MMAATKFETLHPDPNKTNKKIDAEKYWFIREHILALLADNEYTHTNLMEALYADVKDKFNGGVQWYGEVVKLDLEARTIIERTNTKPEKYRIVLNKQQL